MFKNKLTNSMLRLILLAALYGNAQADPVQTMSYQAYLKDSAGLPVNATENITFRIYTTSSGLPGGEIWSDTLNITITDGLFSVELGSIANPLPKASMNNPLWLGIEIGTDGQTSPLTSLKSVNNAFYAEDANTLGGMTSTDLLQSVDITAHTADADSHHSKTTSFVDLTDTAADAQLPAEITRDSELSSHASAASAHHTKTTALPWESITSIPSGFRDGVDNDSGGDITGVIAGLGLDGGANSGDATLRVGIPLALNGSRSSYIIGGFNTFASTDARGVHGFSISGIGVNGATDTGYGVKGSATDTGIGVYGISTLTTGVYGVSTSGPGVHGASDTGTGVFGSSNLGRAGFFTSNGDGVHGNAASDGIAVQGTANTGVAGYFSSSSGYGVIVSSGKVGVGTTAPNSRLQVNSSGSTEHALRAQVGGATKLIVASNGSVGVGSYLTSPAGKLQVGGGNDAVLTDDTSGYIVSGLTGGLNIVIDDNEIMARNNGAKTKLYLNKDSSYVVVPGLEVTGGADLVEPFDIADEGDVLPGMVVSIDPDVPGKLRISTSEFDRTVAGIVSGANGINPGLSMAQQHSIADGSHPVALTGRLYALADAAYGAIEPGDLLTTSDTPGHVMKVTDHTRAQGAVIGKAMTFLNEGKGHVLVLVSLQ